MNLKLVTNLINQVTEDNSLNKYRNVLIGTSSALLLALVYSQRHVFLEIVGFVSTVLFVYNNLINSRDRALFLYQVFNVGSNLLDFNDDGNIDSQDLDDFVDAMLVSDE